MIYEGKIDIKKIVMIAIAICFIHGLSLYKSIPKYSYTKPVAEKAKKGIKFKILNQIAKSKQIVQTNKTKEEVKVKKAFLGKQKSTYLRETVAKNVGTFKNASKGLRTATSTKDQTASRKSKKVSFKDLALKGFNPAEQSKKKVTKQASIKKGLKRGTSKIAGLSQANDFVKDIPLGDFTRLNTQEFEFYGFYHRIRQKLEQFWGRNIQEQAQAIARQGRTIASGTNHVTALQIELNSKGEIIGVKVKGASGVNELDQTAVRTFNEAGPFPNPPEKMLTNGKVLINWSFVVTT